jgi:uracil-DNA glycosylase
MCLFGQLAIERALIGGVRQVKTRGMPTGSNPDLAREFAAVLDWWREAGVDCDFVDAPTTWIDASGAAEPGSQPAQESRAIAAANDPGAPFSREAGNAPGRVAPASALAPASHPIPKESLPTDLAAFQQWWMQEPALDEGRTGQRIPPRGPRGAGLMVLVPEPEVGDRERLLSGPQGRLLEGFFQATKLDPDLIYHASFLPRHSPGTDWHGAEPAGLAPAVLRHILLAEPKRLLVLGFNVLPLLGNEPPQGPASLAILKHEGTTIPMLAARALAGMDQRPSWKAALWKEWLDWKRA